MYRAFMPLVCCLFVATAWAASVSKLEVAITNPTDQSRAVENIVIPVSDLRRAAPHLNPACVIVSTDDGTELPSQIDDLDGDNKADENFS